jgi:hypothetical protein
MNNMTTFKKIFNWSFVLLLVISAVGLFAADIDYQPYSYTVSGQHQGCVSGGSCYNTNSSYPECRTSPGHWLNYSCSDGASGIWCDNHPLGLAGHTSYSYTAYGSKYVCNYASSVSQWSPCSIGEISSYAISFNYSTRDVSSADDPSCVDVAATRSCPTYSQNLTASCSANVNTASINEAVVWIANPSGGAKNLDGSDSYTYSWTGTDGLLGNTRSVNKNYDNIGFKYATTTITSGSIEHGNFESVTIGCTLPAGGVPAGGGNGGVKITNNGRCNPITNNQEFLVKPITNLCSSAGGNSEITETDLSDSWTINKIWNWNCYGTGLDSVTANCSASFKSTDENLTCNLLMNPYGPTVNINTNTGWEVSPTSTRPVLWKIEDTNSTTYPAVTGYNLNKIFTTVGLKTVSAKIGSTTAGVYGNPCTATTTVIQVGSIREI